MLKKVFAFLVLFSLSVYPAAVAVDMDGTGDRSTCLTGWAGACKFDTLPNVTYTAGDTVYIRGNGAIAGNVSLAALDGSSASPIAYIGVKSTTTNWPPVVADYAVDTAGMPHINIGANLITFGDYPKISVICFYGARSSSITFGLVPIVKKCSFISNGATPNSNFIGGAFPAYGVYDSCWFISTGSGVTTSTGSKFNSCYFKSVKTAITSSGGVLSIVGCFFDTANCAINTTADNYHNISLNTFKKCDTVLSATTDYGIIFKNNIIDSTCLYVYKWITSNARANYISNNLIDSSAAMITWTNVDSTGIYCDTKRINADPLLFETSDSLLTGSPAIGTASW
jgi:hypothetical protein